MGRSPGPRSFPARPTFLTDRNAVGALPLKDLAGVPVSGQLSPRRIIQSNVVPLGNLVAMRAVNIWNIYYVRCLVLQP
jgi:hypothetical protein